jgi:hypothetical protein
MRFYLDTSIFGGLLDQEFKNPTRALFDFIKTKRIKIIYSDILEKELELAPKNVKLLATNKLVQAECIDITEEMLELAKMYIKVHKRRSSNTEKYKRCTAYCYCNNSRS